MRHLFRPPSRAFTLVELLVVVGIIALLVAFLLPVLAAARDQARLVDDLSRIRQCGMIAISVYANDNGGAILPAWGFRAGFPSPGCISLSGWDAIRVPYTAIWPDFIQMYVEPHNQRDNIANFRQYSGILYCSGDPVWTASRGPGWWFGGLYREFSWRINFAVSPAVSDLTPGSPTFGLTSAKLGRKVTQIRNASRKVYLAESHYESCGGVSATCVTAETHAWGAGVLSKDVIPAGMRWPPLNAISYPRHRSGFVAVFCDGHGEIIPFTSRETFRIGATFGTGPNWDLDKP